MKLIVTDTYEQMSKLAAMELFYWLNQSRYRRVNLAVTAGRTPKKMYELLPELLKDLTFENVHYYNFDEIPTRDGEHITMDELNESFFFPCHIDTKQIEVFSEHNYEDYEKKIEADGGLDLILMGLGLDGHFCGNLSGTVNSWNDGCRRVDRPVKGRADYYVTFGPRTVMAARRIVMIVNGTQKAEILKKVLEGPISTEIPSSILRLHPDFTVIADREAAALLSRQWGL